MKTSTKLHLIALIAVNCLLAHYIISSIPLRIDATEENLYSLTENSESIIDKIEDTVTLDFYYTKSVKLPPELAPFKNFANRVEQILKQYERAGNGKIVLNIIDPEPDSEEEENAIAAGVHGQDLPTGDRIFLGLVAIQGDTEQNIRFFDQNREIQGYLEFDISTLIYEVQQLAKPKLGLITGLPLQSPPIPPQMMMQMGRQQEPDQYIYTALSQNYDLEVIEAAAESLPSDLDILAIIHPIGLTEGLVYTIDQHILKGKPLFLAIDPSSRLMREQSRQQQMGGMMGQPSPNVTSDIPQLLEAWGIEFDSQSALADPTLAYAQQGQSMPTVLVAREGQKDSSLLPMNGVEDIWILEAGSLRLSDESSLTLQPIVKTTDRAGSINAMMLSFMNPASLMNQLEPLEGEQIIAGLLTGEFKTAFPDGKPGAGETEEQEGETEPAAHISSGESSVFIIADSDWVLDPFSVQRSNFLGMQQIQLFNGNQTLASNFIDYLGGSQDLIGIRSKKAITRDFDVVEEMQAVAQEKFQARQQELDEQIQAVQQELQNLLQQQTGSGLIVASPELQEAIEKQREQEVSMRAERRQIRRELTKDIERLGTRLAAINVLWAPIILIGIGLFYRSVRKRTL
ncbi:MAG: GldG family protein [Verrucomicrobiota bacterium]